MFDLILRTNRSCFAGFSRIPRVPLLSEPLKQQIQTIVHQKAFCPHVTTHERVKLTPWVTINTPGVCRIPRSARSPRLIELHTAGRCCIACIACIAVRKSLRMEASEASESSEASHVRPRRFHATRRCVGFTSPMALEQ